MSIKGGLGRGFDSLFTDNSPESEGGAVMLPIADVEPDPTQPRRDFDIDKLTELSESIRTHGVIQPILVRPRSDGSYLIVAGERRWRASRMAGLKEIPAQVKALSDAEAAELTLIENLQREDLNPTEEAEGIRKLIDEYDMTQEQAAETLGKSRAAVANTLRLLNLPPETYELLRSGSITAGHARALLGLDDAEEINYLAAKTAADGLSVREVEKQVKAQSSRRRTRAQKPRDQFIMEAEIALSNLLGRAVRIKESSKGGGVVELPFFDNDDLKKMLMRISAESEED